MARFKLIWWDKGSGSKDGVSIWCLIVPPRCSRVNHFSVLFFFLSVAFLLYYFCVGLWWYFNECSRLWSSFKVCKFVVDCSTVILLPQGWTKDVKFCNDFLACSYEPPSIGLVLNDTLQGGLLAKPLKFQERGQITKQRGMEEGVPIWYPVALPGYVAMGCIASKSSAPEPNGANHVCYVCNELVTCLNFTVHSIWDSSTLRYGNEELSMWFVENEVIVGHGDVHTGLHSSGLLPKWYCTFTML